MGTQTNDLELDGVEWASPGAGRPMGSAAPEVGPLSLLFLSGGRVSFVSHFCEVHPPPTLVSVPVQNLKTKYGTNKRNSAKLEFGEFKLYYIEIKRALIT